MSSSVTSSVSSREMASRQECLDSLGEFIERCQENITSMLDTLGWTPEHFMQPRNQCECPHNSSHRMPESSLEKHTRICEMVSQGYSKEDAEKITEDRSFYYKDASCVYPVKLDLDTLNSVLWNHHVQNHSVFYGYKKIPRTAEEEQVLMSREDRLGVAEYVVKRAKEANRLKELGQDDLLVSENLADLIKKDNEERKLDPFEEMAALRDYRRRRQTYRAKNVHITKKSHTEIMREVINNQMEMYTQSVVGETGQVPPHMSHDEDETGSRSIKTEDGEGYRPGERDERSRQREHRRYGRSRSRDRQNRSSRRSRSRSRDRSSRYERDDQTSTDGRSTRDSRRRSRSRSDEPEKSKSKRKHRSRSRSLSSERSKKSKHKKHKHKHKKHKKQERKSEDRDSDNEKREDSGEVNDQ
ncbi:U11/U12 small nuclear ribonucleoprotein 48 kDa protein-like [Mercenaria mercenaria]|uniref:U11/U12 small nuclear ribonucleoprotein 48 kDa protein-like n=1 Tax=Mercenaria mercenaria TaxID=6596 RepID=UPI00234F9786|nr:U11/U12 small nuclear ribonucleoprotein 48 kDa protein-like [Mercenaria mercenaria]XP_053402613.1 U11/U12 small nuclear ribonucleoprotein 48 kDa protein-like [Mercenaria mercenaria]